MPQGYKLGPAALSKVPGTRVWVDRLTLGHLRKAMGDIQPCCLAPALHLSRPRRVQAVKGLDLECGGTTRTGR